MQHSLKFEDNVSVNRTVKQIQSSLRLLIFSQEVNLEIFAVFNIGWTLNVGLHPLFRTTLDLKKVMANILLNSLICFTKSFDCAVSPFNRLHNGSGGLRIGGSLTSPLEQHMPGVSHFHLSALHFRQTFDILPMSRRLSLS
ncbi:hypothetical protein TNCV_3864611 [Trichonephila clavipes]|nr:hypothetical protein TNCV_3864611 [Trichonephila clavipes]